MVKPGMPYLDIIKLVKDNFKILHPMPRKDELPCELDQTKYAYYFEQAKLGVPVRAALLSLISFVNESIPFISPSTTSVDPPSVPLSGTVGPQIPTSVVGSGSVVASPQ